MAKKLDPNCSENFAVWGNHVYFQAGGKGLYRVPCNGSKPATKLDDNAGYLVVPGDSYVYFQAGSKGLYRVPCDGSAPAQKLDENAGHLAVSGDFVYFQAGSKGLYRVPRDGSEPAQRLDPNCGRLVVPGDGYVYFQAGKKGLYRIRCDGTQPAQQLDPNCKRLAVPGDDYVYFQAGSKGLYRVRRNGSSNAQQLDPNCEHFVVSGDSFVYFQAGSKGLYRVPCDGSAPAQPLDENAGNLVVFGDGYVYFQAGKKGLYRVRTDAKTSAVQLDPNCGNLVASRGYIYFQGGPGWNELYRLGVAIPSAPPGLRFMIQDEYVVPTVLSTSIEKKYDAIVSLIDEAGSGSSDTWFLNFTSGASTGAYPDAVAGRINDQVKMYISKPQTSRNRLGTVAMDFPKDDLIAAIIGHNATSQSAPANWMSGINANKKLSEISIPGTHDTCTWKATPISRCQNRTLPEQLAAGVRFIDIRCRHYKDKFELHHGSEYLGMDFSYVLKSCRKFLTDQPQECIVMSVKEEHDAADNKKTFEQVFNKYVATDAGLWYLGNTIPTLGAVRQKVVLLRRFYISPDSNPAQRGIDLTAWIDNATFTWPTP